MTTVKFATDSPYKQEKQQHHITDFKYKEFLVGSGQVKSNNKEVPEHLKVINVALFAFGRAGSIHLTNIMKNSRLHLTYLVESDREKLESVQKEWSLPDSVLLSPQQDHKVFSDPSVHGIIIATPTYLHKDLVTRGLKARKAVFCEKPIADDLEDTRMCYQLAKEMNQPLLCAFNRRFDPSFCQLRQKVQAGEVGQVHLVKTVARDCPLPSIEYIKVSGGLYHDCAVHDIDLVCWVLGEYPTHVFATASAFIPEIAALNDHDTIGFTMKFASGTISMTDISRNAVYGYDQRLEVFGPKGMVSSSNERPYPLVTSNVHGTSEPPLHYSFPSRYCQGYINELNHFCDVVQGVSEVSIPGDNTLKVTRIASALAQSAATGQMVEMVY
ncbi:hypothetical protein Pmani_022295 [Petrolisthes manimaculis]|uniref:Uncharacterized protein n=1 Tax=Petrolisthes manimaculis TaxID=1843537 RepID=A0AAE1U1A7_9EUCA|nr:hypothetical protein Pmani_022295 [Petrolisthes manimaculis]